MRLWIGMLLAGAALAAEPAEIFRLIRSNDRAELSKLLASKTDVNVRGDRQMTPLIYAAAHGSPEAVRMLIDAGADVNAANALGVTPLMLGINDPEKVRLLLKAGADVNAKSKLGRTALLLAANQNGSLDLVKHLVSRGADLKVRDSALGADALFMATAANDTAMARYLIDSGLAVNTKTVQGNTPLMNAASFGNLELIRLLIAKGANVNAVSSAQGPMVKNGMIQLAKFTPLILASTFGTPEVLAALLDAGADINATDVRGMTPLMLAVTSESQNPASVKLLLARGAQISTKSSNGESAQDWAAKFNHPESLQVFKLKNRSAGYASAKLEGAADPRAAAEKALTLLTASNGTFFKNSGCVGCHHQNMTSMALGVASDHGLRYDRAAAADLGKSVRLGWATFSDGLMQRMDAPGGPGMVAFSLLGLGALRQEPDAVTDAMVHNIAACQDASGAWFTSGIARAPSSDGSVSETVLGLRALQLYGSPGRKAEFDGRVKKAQAWLLKAHPRHTEESTMQLLGLTWSDADSSTIQRLAKELLKKQRKDGGWAQNGYLASDAYATGQSLYALSQAGILNIKDPEYQRGVQFLLSTQKEDGSWYVKSRSVKFQPYFQSGFPHDHDQWISAMGTAWATMALSLTVDPQQVAQR